MNLRQIQDIAGHRDVPPWVIKLVQDCIEHDRMYERPRLTLTCPICAGTLMESVDAQIAEAVADMKEKAAKVCDEMDVNADKWDCADAIRSMK